jgi:flagellar L-ring protein precursor FlgH
MHRIRFISLMVALGLCLSGYASGQTSSLGARHRQEVEAKGTQAPPRGEEEQRGNPTVERYSWISTKPAEPPTFRVNDLVTIIVRESSKYEAEAELESEKEYDVRSELDAFLKLTDGGMGAAKFSRGKPNVDYKFKNELEGEADASREDRFTTRITAKVIDVKPNGSLVLEARGYTKHDDEVRCMTLTGTCRKEDVTADNTVLSSRLADLSIVVDTEGALHDSTRRGWIPKLLDLLKPF